MLELSFSGVCRAAVGSGLFAPIAFKPLALHGQAVHSTTFRDVYPKGTPSRVLLSCRHSMTTNKINVAAITCTTIARDKLSFSHRL